MVSKQRNWHKRVRKQVNTFVTKHGLHDYRDAMHLLIDQMDDEQRGSEKLWAAAIAYAIGEETGWYTTSKKKVRPRHVYSHFRISAGRVVSLVHELRQIDRVGVFELEEYEVYERMYADEDESDFVYVDRSVRLEQKLKERFGLEGYVPEDDIENEIYRYDDTREEAFYQEIRRLAYPGMFVHVSESAIEGESFAEVPAEIVDIVRGHSIYDELRVLAIVELESGKLKQREVGQLEILQGEELEQLCELYDFYVTRRRELNFDMLFE